MGPTLHAKNLEKGRTITSEHYSNLFYQLDIKICEKRPVLKKKKIIFHQNKAPAHKTVGFEAQFAWPSSYSPNLVPLDFHLFPYLNKSVSGKRFTFKEEWAIDEYFNSLPEENTNIGESLDQVF